MPVHLYGAHRLGRGFADANSPASERISDKVLYPDLNGV
jgi:hypothetical protein